DPAPTRASHRCRRSREPRRGGRQGRSAPADRRDVRAWFRRALRRDAGILCRPRAPVDFLRRASPTRRPESGYSGTAGPPPSCVATFSSGDTPYYAATASARTGMVLSDAKRGRVLALPPDVLHEPGDHAAFQRAGVFVQVVKRGVPLGATSQ